MAALILLVSAGSAKYARVRSDWRELSSRQSAPDYITQEDAAFRSLAPWLPPRGRIGYLPPSDWPGANAVRRFYVAEYSLTPRVVVLGVGPEFLIAVPEAITDVASPSGGSDDPRLAGYALVRSFASGIRIFRRVG